MKRLWRPAVVAFASVLLLFSVFWEFGGGSANPEVEPSDSRQKSQQPAAHGKSADDANAFDHAPSGTRFRIPEGWTRVGVNRTGRNVYLMLKSADESIDAVLSWTPGNSPLRAVVMHTTEVMADLYGKENVGKAESIAIGLKNYWKIPIKVGPRRDGKDSGVVYVFENSRDRMFRWTIKLRATMKRPQDAAAVRNLLSHFEG